MFPSGRFDDLPLLDVLQVIAYSRKSGVLSVGGPTARGTVVFDHGDIVCAYSTSTLDLLVRAAKERDLPKRFSLRWIQALASLRELFDLLEGDYHFDRRSEPELGLEGLDIRPFYADGALDTGDLLLALAKAMDDASPQSQAFFPSKEDPPQTRGPTIARAELTVGGSTQRGALLNLGRDGAFFRTKDVLGVSDVGTLRFTLPWELGTVEAAVRVVSANADPPSGEKGVALAFEHVPAESMTRLEDYLQQYRHFAVDLDFMA